LTARRISLPWRPTLRAVPSRFPPVSLFDGVAHADELEAVAAIQALTNPRLRAEAGEISLVPPDERVAGPGSTPVMAAFTHLNPRGSRFSDGTWGVYYAGSSLEVAVAEVGFHCARFMAETRQAAIEVDYRVYHATLLQPLHDLRGARWAPVHAPDSYAASVTLAREYRAAQSWGLLYRSVRHAGGECVAVFRPRAVQLPVVQGAHVSLCWDGQAIAGWYLKSDLHALTGGA
jgi:hypothetical protein